MRVLTAWDSSSKQEITARITDDLETGRGGLIRFYGWLNDEPAMFLHRPALDPDTLAVVPLSRVIYFTTPGSMASLYTGQDPLPAEMCAAACAEACINLEWDLSPANINAVLDTVQDGIERLFKMPYWSMTPEGQMPTRVAEIDIFVNGELDYSGEVAK